MSDIELKPCPFCGGESLCEDRLGRISCDRCGATAPYGYGTTKTWNTRAAPKVKPLVWEKCGVYTLSAWTEFGNYNIDIDDGSGWVFMHECHGDAFEKSYGDCHIPDDEVIDELKAAAQADYERRILSALDNTQ